MRPRSVTGNILGFAIAVGFGLATIVQGGAVLFGDGQAREQAGNIVHFVLWFNFLAGFIYVLAGYAFLQRRQWVNLASRFIAGANLAILASLGVYIALGGAFEARTPLAMTLRAVVWIGLAVLAHRTVPVKTEEAVTV